MKLHLILPASAALFLAASCTPYVEPPPPAPVDPAANKQPTEEEKKKAAEQREKKKKEGEELANKEKTTEGATPGPDAGPGATNPDATPPKKPEEKKPIPTAREVPGRPGFVFSPFNNKIIDIRDESGNRRASGKIMSDPTYPASEKKHFRIP
jgi:hypothetical protein